MACMQLDRRAAAACGEPSGAANAFIDFDYLERQCMGDEALAEELLSLFSSQARLLSGEMTQTALSPADLADLAHRLKGSALAIGAACVAGEAARLETLCRDGGLGADMRAALTPLANAVAAACSAVADRSDRARHG